MKTLIVYGTTYGYAKECAQRLKSLLPEDVEVVDAKSAMTLALEPYDQIIIGGSVYMGQVQKTVRKFCTQQLIPLQKKKIGLFLCSGQPDNFDKDVAAAFPEELRRQAISIEPFGGRMDPSKMNLIHRLITNMVAKSNDKGKAAPIQELPENIQRMADAMMAE